MKMILESWNQYLQEGKFDKETTALVYELIPRIKNFLEETEKSEFHWQFPGTEFGVEIVVLRARRGSVTLDPRTSGAMRVGTAMSDNEYLNIRKGQENVRMIEINVFIPDEWEDSMWQELLSNLRGTVRHELEHSGQYIKGNMESSGGHKENVDEILKYYLTNSEVEAYVAGIYKRAKSGKVDFSQVLENTLGKIRYRLFNAAIDEEELKKAKSGYKKIKDTWISYAKKRFPGARGI